MDDTHAMFRHRTMHDGLASYLMLIYYDAHHDVQDFGQRNFQHRQQQHYHFQLCCAAITMILILSRPTPAKFSKNEKLFLKFTQSNADGMDIHTSVLFLPNSRYVANTSSQRTCDNESSISWRLQPMATSASVERHFQ